MLQHQWLADEKPNFVPDLNSPTGGPRDLPPHIQKCLCAKARSEFLQHTIFLTVMLKLLFLTIRGAVWTITVMKRMLTLASLPTSN